MKTLREIVRTLANMPQGTMVPAAGMVETLASLAAEHPEPEPQPAVTPAEMTWRSLLWLVPAETRLGPAEVAEAVGRSLDWVHRHTSPKIAGKKGYSMLPHRKLEGALVFRAGELRAWIRDNEEILSECRMESAPADRLAWRVDTGKVA